MDLINMVDRAGLETRGARVKVGLDSYRLNNLTVWVRVLLHSGVVNKLPIVF